MTDLKQAVLLQRQKTCVDKHEQVQNYDAQRSTYEQRGGDGFNGTQTYRYDGNTVNELADGSNSDSSGGSDDSGDSNTSSIEYSETSEEESNNSKSSKSSSSDKNVKKGKRYSVDSDKSRPSTSHLQGTETYVQNRKMSIENRIIKHSLQNSRRVASRGPLTPIAERTEDTSSAEMS